MASEGEGFGLPLVAAAYAGLPVIARRLPVFEEVARNGVTRCEGTAPEAIVDAVRGWFDPSIAGTLPDPASVPTLGWVESSLELTRIVLDDAWQERCTPPAL